MHSAAYAECTRHVPEPLMQIAAQTNRKYSEHKFMASHGVKQKATWNIIGIIIFISSGPDYKESINIGGFDDGHIL